ncbi:MAG: FAD-binding oxidoreductase [Acidobacteriia bacterium]|nr:FAD-binding oxidoreductase [Terriglobia bacterium]
MRIPPGLTSKDFSDALGEFAAAVGKEWVFTSDEDLALYRDAYSPMWGEPGELIASAAVAPDGVEQVQKVVRIANHYKIPIYPVSTGKNLGYGGSAPVYSGSVVLDLKRMNRILEVNERNAYALVEPGVSYFDLYRYIQEKGLKLWVDVPDPGWGSPIGNSLDRGGGYLMAEYRNHFDSHCGMEVVLANGEILRTGMGALPGAKTWQQYKTGFGPWIDGIFSQSNFGVVTKMGFWLMPEPDAYLSGIVHVPKRDDLIPLVDTLNYLENTRVTNGMPDLASPLLGIPMLADFEGLFEKGSSPFAAPRDPEVAAVSAKPGGGSPEEIGARGPTNPNPTSGHMWFSPIIPRTGEAIFAANRVFSQAAQEFGLPSLGFSLPSCYWERAFIYIFALPVTRDAEFNKRNRAVFQRMIQLAAERGWGEYRTAPAYQDAIMNTYSYNNHALLRFHELLKDAVDPNGILSAGRYGIWPKHLRKAKP